MPSVYGVRKYTRIPGRIYRSTLVTRDARIMSGALCFAGTRVPVQTLFDHLEGKSQHPRMVLPALLPLVPPLERVLANLAPRSREFLPTAHLRYLGVWVRAAPESTPQKSRKSRQALAGTALGQASQLPNPWYERRSDPLARPQSLALNASFGRAAVKGR